MNSSHHVLFAGRSVFHFPYYESVCEALVAGGARISFFFDAEASAAQSDLALQLFLKRHPETCTLRFVTRPTGVSYTILRVCRELRAYCHYLRRTSGSSFYVNRQSRYLPAWISWISRVRLLKHFFSSRVLSEALQRLEGWIAVDPVALLEIRNQRPTVIFAAPVNMRFSREVDFVKAGKLLNIPTFGLVQTWDNLTTKGIFHVRPDHLFCWNEQHRLEAIEIHGFSTNSTSVVGSPFYDKWFIDKNLPLERAPTLKMLGLNPDEQYLVYLGSSANIARDESWLVDKIVQIVQSSTTPKLRVVVRPHPVNSKWADKYKSSRSVVVDSSSTLPEDESSVRELAGVLTHSQLSLGINTSAMIDSVVLGKSCVALLSSRYSQTQSEALHFKMLRRTGALHECSADDTQSLTELIRNSEIASSPERTTRILPLVRSQLSNELAGQLIANHVLSSQC